MNKFLRAGLFISIAVFGSSDPSIAQPMPGMDMPAAPRALPAPSTVPTSRPPPAQASAVPSTPDPRTSSILTPGADWPEPVADREKRTMTLFDLLDYRPQRGGGDLRWDIVGWSGGDYERIWFKTEGESDTDFKSRYDVDFQLLYGKLIRPFYDLQCGVRVEARKSRGRRATRAFAALGLEGLARYRFDVEPTLFVSDKGDISARFTVNKDFMFSQRLILQSRFETNLALQQVEEFAVGSGINNLELGLRLRYELKRELAPYVGVSYDRSLGHTATLVRRDGADPEQLLFVAGMRLWY